MKPDMIRFTGYLSVAERDEIRKQAKLLGASENYVLRLVIREHYRLTIPGAEPDEPERV